MPPHVPKDLLARIPAFKSPRLNRLAELHARLDLAILARTWPRFKLFSVLKYVAFIVFFANFGSLPFMWHIRVFWPIFAVRVDHGRHCIQHLFASRKKRSHALIKWAEDLSPVGANPFELDAVYTRWATLDDCDMFGMHLSNSSYAKAFDAARTKAMVKFFPTWGRSGGYMALGASHYHFVREILPLTKYQVRLSIGSWDHKWLYIVARFVSRPGSRGTSCRSPPSQFQSQASTSSTPSGASTPPSFDRSTNVERAVAAVVEAENKGTDSPRRAPIVEPDGAILHCVAVAQMCCKRGRLTVPPAIVLASEGFTKPRGDSDVIHNGNVNGDIHSGDKHTPKYSRANPPPNWAKSQALRVPPQGSMDNFRAFLKGKWREVPEGERWWEEALGCSVEARRCVNLEILGSLRTGMERTQALRYD